MSWRAHHLKFADSLLAAVKDHSDFLDTRIEVFEQGKRIMVVLRDGDFGPTVEFEQERDQSGAA